MYTLSSAELERYVCVCGARHCKLWRFPANFTRAKGLRCATCALAVANLVTEIGPKGRHSLGTPAKNEPMDTDRIGILVPAVPIPKEGVGNYWRYNSIPKSAREWWETLPTYSQISL